jgi:ankyrin repeat protein
MQEFYTAVRAGDLERVKSLVAADPALAIFAAAMLGDVPEMEALLAGNRSLVSLLSPDGWTPLHLAAHFGKIDTVRTLLNKGAQVNARSTNAMQNMH